MSKIKRGISLQLVLMVLALAIVMIVPVSAEPATDFSVELVTDTVELVPGAEFNATLNFYGVKDVGGLAGFGPFGISYDTSVLTVVSVTKNQDILSDDGDLFVDIGAVSINMNYVNFDDKFPGSDSGVDEICTIKFKVKDDASIVSKLFFSMNCTDYMNAMGDPLAQPVYSPVEDNTIITTAATTVSTTASGSSTTASSDTESTTADSATTTISDGASTTSANATSITTSNGGTNPSSTKAPITNTKTGDNIAILPIFVMLVSVAFMIVFFCNKKPKRVYKHFK